MQWRFPLKFSRTDRPVVANDECDEIEPLLSLYSDGMTSPAETRRVEAHLADCESCRKSHFWMRATYEVISHRPMVMPPPDMASRIQRAIAEADGVSMPGVGVRLRFNPRPAYAFAAALLIAAVVIPITRSMHTGRTNVALVTPPSYNNVSPPSIVPLPTPPSIVKPTTPHVTHAPVNVAKVTHETGNPPSHELAHERRQPAVVAHDDVVTVVHHPTSPVHTMLATNHTSTPPAIHHAVIQTQPETHVARNTPAPSSTHVDVVPHVTAPQPAPPPVVSPTPDRVATSTTHDDAPVAVSSPPAPVVVASAAETHHGLNDSLRDAVESVHRPGLDRTMRAFTVAEVNMAKPPRDSASWVGATGN